MEGKRERESSEEENYCHINCSDHRDIKENAQVEISQNGWNKEYSAISEYTKQQWHGKR